MINSELFINLQELINGELQFQQSIDHRIIKSVIRAILNTVPQRQLEHHFESYVKSSLKDDKPTIEVSILTEDNFVFDYTFNLIERSICFVRINPDTSIVLQEFHNLDEEVPNEDKEIPAYRADLRIHSQGEGYLQYSAEGNKRTVDKLISYGHKCFLSLDRSLPINDS